jgi:hypothetical protein
MTNHPRYSPETCGKIEDSTHVSPTPEAPTHELPNGLENQQTVCHIIQMCSANIARRLDQGEPEHIVLAVNIAYNPIAVQEAPLKKALN